MRSEARVLILQIVFILLTVLLASIGKASHAPWLVISATVFWILTNSGWCFIPGRGGLPAGAVVVFAILTMLLSLVYGIVFFTFGGAMIVTVLSLVAFLVGQVAASR